MKRSKIRFAGLLFSVCLLILVIQGASQVQGGQVKPSAEPGLSGVINVNTATLDDLRLLPRIGEATALRIIEFREKHGPFQQPIDLMNVRGIGPKVYQLLESYLVVEGATTLTDSAKGGVSGD